MSLNKNNEKNLKSLDDTSKEKTTDSSSSKYKSFLRLREPNKKREYLYTLLLIGCSLYIIYVFFIDDEEILIKSKEYCRSDFIINLDQQHQAALKHFIKETIDEKEKEKCKKDKIKDKIKLSLPILFMTSLLQFKSYEETLDVILTSFIGLTIIIVLESSIKIY
jgi:hypothetical protein